MEDPVALVHHHPTIVIRVTIIDTTLATIHRTLEDDGNVTLVVVVVVEDLPLHPSIVVTMTIDRDHHHHAALRRIVVVFRKIDLSPVDLKNMAATVSIQVLPRTVRIPSKRNGPMVIVTVPGVGRLVPVLQIT
jgi:hypothetical protein